MLIGARPLGSRTLGDGTGDSGAIASGTSIDVVPAAATITITATASIGVSTSLVPAAATIVVTATADQVKAKNLIPEEASIVIRGELTIPPQGTRRRVFVVDMNGIPLGEIETAIVGPVTWSLNTPDEFSFTVLADDPKAALITSERFREVQIWRGDMILTWGPTTRVSQDLNVLTVSCKDCLWYFSRRFIGKANRTNYLSNGSFEDGLAGWNIATIDPREPLVGRNPAWFPTVTTSARSVTGRFSARMDQVSDTQPKYGAAIGFTMLWAVPAAKREGDTFTVAVQAFVPSATLRSTIGGGIKIARYSTTEFVSITTDDGLFTGSYPMIIDNRIVPITPDFPVNSWVRLEAELFLPPRGQLEFLQIELMGVRGIIDWDAASLTLNERLEWFSQDQTSVIAKGLIEHLQDPAYDKSDLKVRTECPPSGVMRDAVFVFSEHPPGLDSINQFTKLDNGFDHRVVYTATKRTYTTQYPAFGLFRRGCGLELGRNIATFTWAFDGEAASSAVVTLGQGSGSDREEGFAEDVSAYANGLTLEEVFIASPETAISALSHQAIERLAVTLHPEVLEATTFPLTEPGADRILGYVKVGDVVPVTLPKLGILGDHYRIVRMVLNPDDTMAMTLNRREVNM